MCVKFLDRKQAVSIVKEILDKCKAIEGKSIKLLPPKEDEFSSTYQIYIDIKNDPFLEQCIVRVIEKYQLDTKISGNWIIIYKTYNRKQ